MVHIIWWTTVHSSNGETMPLLLRNTPALSSHWEKCGGGTMQFPLSREASLRQAVSGYPRLRNSLVTTLIWDRTVPM